MIQLKISICRIIALQVVLFVVFQYSIGVHSMEGTVVSDPNVVHSPFGVPVDLRFNETAYYGNASLTSAAGCPSPLEDLPWLYYGTPPKCFLVGTIGPCPSGQIFFGNLSSSYGYCDCVCDGRHQNDSFDHLLKINESDQFRFCRLRGDYLHKINEAVFDKNNGSCYFLETQGVCAPQEWMVKDENGTGVTCISQCSSTYGSLSTHTFDYQTRKCIEKPDGLAFIQPISLAMNIGPRDCEDGKVYSKTLNRCIPKSKAFFMRIP